MWDNKKRKLYLGLVPCFVVALLIGLVPDKASAALTGCLISLAPQAVAPGSDTNFTFQITDTSSDPIQWVKVVRPGGGYVTIASAAASGWDSINTAGLAIFTNGSVPASSSRDFIVEATADNETPSPVNWTVLVSDNAGGAGPISCSGDLSMMIASQPSDITISNVTVAAVTSSSATITWDTDIASTSQVSYGSDSSYGSSSQLSSALVTSHSVTLASLSSATGYHYQVTSTTPDGGSSSSGDDTFLTADGQSTPPDNQPPAGSDGGSGSTLQLLGGGIPILARPTEKVVPTISLSTSLASAFKTSPSISGTADDNLTLARLQYSTDGGKNWLPVDESVGLGSKHASFSFTPIVTADGNYDILARAIDTSGNIGLSAPATLIIDQLPPLVGGDVISLGPQLLSPDTVGVITSLTGVDQKITLSSIGGPTSVVLHALPLDKQGKNQSFTLTKSADTGLWSGIASFAQAGQYNLIASAADGAGTKTTRVLGTVYVLHSSRTLDGTTHKPVISKVTIHYFDVDSESWVVWDGAPYGQTNPQTTDHSGSFNVFLPPGKYYVEARAAGYHTAISSIFKSDQSLPLTTDIELKPSSGLKLGSLHVSWPTFSVQQVSLQAKQTKTVQRTPESRLVGKQVPSFNLSDTSGRTVHSVDLLGKPTVITFGATWEPGTAEQVGILASLQTNKDINVVPIAVQEDAAKVEAATAVAGLDLNWLVDPTSSLTNGYAIQNLPTHYFLDRKGIVQKITVGVLTKQQILDALASL